MRQLESPESSASKSLPSADQDRLAQILDEYLLAIERGAAIPPEELFARHPLDADRLRGYLSGLKLFHDAAAMGPPANVGQPRIRVATQNGQIIGDYRLLREIGRGGMGVVYEAYQISLRRRVALKVLPFTAAHDAKQISRFKNEAQAAAQVQHPNIVPVFAVGDEHGIHYYAMQLIVGQSLASMLGVLRGDIDSSAAGTTAPGLSQNARDGEITLSARGPASALPGSSSLPMDASRTADRVRTVARLGIQAAEALNAAHEFGVVHRDVKPSNLLVDENGKLWVTDFGLARFRDDSGLTRTGDVLGTMRYMSPEQALGRAALVDHRTDVYSLGVTLYELAALRHPAEGLSDAQLLFDRKRSSCKRLRHWNRQIAIDFETIVMKSIAEFPQERYASAQELADDLRRFDEGKPIIASRPSILVRAGKWAKRHRSAVYAAAAILILAFAGLTSGLFLVARGKAQTDLALAESQENFRQVRTVLDRFGTRLAEQLAAIPGAEGVRRQLLDDSLSFYRQFARKAADDPSLLADQALAQSKIGDLTTKLGDKQQALESHTAARRILQNLVDEHPSNAQYVHSLALCENNVALLLAEIGRAPESLESLEKARDLLNNLLSRSPDSDDLSADLATTLSNLGFVLSKTGARNGAGQKFRDAIAIDERLVKNSPGNEAVLRSLAASYNNLGSLHESSEVDVAIESYQKAIAVQHDLVSSHPLNRIYQSDLARTYNNLGLVSSHRKDWTKSEQCYAGAIRIQENLVAMSPLAASYQRDLAVSYNNLGMVQNQVGRDSDAEASFRKALNLQRALLATHSKDEETLSNLGGIYNNIAMLFERRGRLSEAEKAYREAIGCQQQALDAAPGSEPFRDLLSKHYFNLARVLGQQGKPGAAADAAIERGKLWPGKPDRLYSVVQELVADCQQISRSADSDAKAQQVYWDAALATLRDAVAAGLPIERLSDASIAPLAGRPEFQQLLTESGVRQPSPNAVEQVGFRKLN